jgi:hypothetical protein
MSCLFDEKVAKNLELFEIHCYKMEFLNFFHLYCKQMYIITTDKKYTIKRNVESMLIFAIEVNINKMNDIEPKKIQNLPTNLFAKDKYSFDLFLNKKVISFQILFGKNKEKLPIMPKKVNSK